MNRPLWIFLCFAFSSMGAQVDAQSGAKTKADQRLAELLAPHAKPPVIATAPVGWKPARALPEITLPIPPYAGVPAPLPSLPLKAFKPRSAAREIPLVAYREASQAPQSIELPTEPLVRLPAVEVNEPLPIPVLARPVPDRASLADPSLAASLEAALLPITPSRTQSLPFTPINLPDPFENQRTGQLRNPPEESPVPPALPTRTP